MDVPITTASPVDAGGTSVIKDLDGNLILKKGDLPPMTIRQGTVAPDTWAALSAKAAPMPTPADVGVVPEVPGMPPGVPLPAQTPIKYGSPTSGPLPGTGANGGTPTPIAQPQAKPFDPLSLVGTSPKIAAMQERAIAEQKQANNEIAGLQEQRALEEAQAQRKANAAIDKVVADSQAQRDYLMNRYELEERARADAVEQASKMKVDPNRLLSQRSTSDEVKWGIAAFFGGIGAALTGGPNMAVEALNRAIDRDIDAQKNAIANAKDTVNMRTNTVAQMRQKITDFDQAVMAAKQVQLERAKRAVEQLATEYGGPEAKARAMALNSGLDAKLAELKEQQDAHAKARMVQLLDKMPQVVSREQDPLWVPVVGNTGFRAKTPQEAVKLREAQGAINGVKADVQRMLDLADAHGNESFGEVAKEYDVLQSRIIQNLNQAGGLGALDKGSLDLLEKQIGDATAVFGTGNGTKDRLNALLRTLDRHAAAKRLSAGAKF